MHKSRFCTRCLAFGASLIVAGTSLAGSITGTVTYDGKVSRLRPIKTSS